MRETISFVPPYTRLVICHASLRSHSVTLKGYDCDTECAATNGTGCWTSTPPGRASFAEPLSNCERPATRSKHLSTLLTRRDGSTADANSHASKWTSTFPSMAASGGGKPCRPSRVCRKLKAKHSRLQRDLTGHGLETIARTTMIATTYKKPVRNVR